jgi:hypothetical protein
LPSVIVEKNAIPSVIQMFDYGQIFHSYVIPCPPSNVIPWQVPAPAVEPPEACERISDRYTAPREIAQPLAHPCNDVNGVPPMSLHVPSNVIPRPPPTLFHGRCLHLPWNLLRLASVSATDILHPRRLHGQLAHPCE